MELGECDIDHVLKLSTGPLKLEGTLTVSPVDSVKGISVSALNAYLTGREVHDRFIDPEALEILCGLVHNAPLESHEMVVANGKPAIHGDSVTYTLEEEIESQVNSIKERAQAISDGIISSDIPDSEFGIAEQGSVSHYDQMSFVIVERGEKIAIKSERSDGADGTDIFGGIIPAHEGKANEGVLDDSINVASDGTCTAAISGVLTANPDNISVSDNLLIKDDVDFKTGRIIFPGSVTVGGAVRDRFCVRAKGEIDIRGLVEVADLESERSITLARGMAGKDVGIIKADLDLKAGYLEGVNGTIGRDAIVRGEITNCELSIRNQLKAENAAVRGGTIQVSKEAKIGSIGSVQGVKTKILIGSLPEVQDDISNADQFIERLEKKISSELAKKDTINNAISKPTPSQIEEIMGMQFEIDELTARLNKLTTARSKLVDLITTHTLPRLQVSKAIYAKSVLYLPGYKVEFSDDLIGEIIIEIGKTGHPSITFRGSTVPLSEYARVMTNDLILRVRETDGLQAAA